MYGTTIGCSRGCRGRFSAGKTLLLPCLVALIVVLVTLPSLAPLPALALAQGSANYYKLLDIDPSSDARTIKKAYRRLAQRLHPDKHPEKEAEFVKMSEAYQVLSDDELRKVYDRFGEEGVKRHRAGQQGPGGGHDPFDIFRNFFGGGGGGQQQQVRKGPAKQFNLMVSLGDLYRGKTITLEYERNVVCGSCDGSGARSKEDIHGCEACGGRGVRIVRQEIMPGFHTQMQAVCSVCSGQGSVVKHACPKCKGAKLVVERTELEVELPPGTEEGETFIFEGESDEGIDLDVEAGDVVVKVNSDPKSSAFRRRASHLYLTRSLSLPEALLGFIETFPHMDGNEDGDGATGGRNVTVDRSQGVTQPGQVVTIKGKGMPVRRAGSSGSGDSGTRGNLYIEYEVVLPDRVEGDLRDILSRVWPQQARVREQGKAAAAERGGPDETAEGVHRHEEL